MKSGADGYRLPTEAQWEYAARGGGTPSTTGSFADWWAGTSTESELDTYAWYDANSGDTTHPVGKKTLNGLGLHDMSGNAWEWRWDWWGESINTGTETDPAGATTGTKRVVRGGSWSIDAPDCAVAYRISHAPKSRNIIWGFRVVCP
jgi:formylglycine-generating enzyme required for sulfatase activity